MAGVRRGCSTICTQAGLAAVVSHIPQAAAGCWGKAEAPETCAAWLGLPSRHCSSPDSVLPRLPSHTTLCEHTCVGREGGSQDGSPRRAYKATGQQLVEDLAAWRSGVSLQDIASSRSIKRGTALQHVLEGWEREGSGAQSLDWQRLLGELQVEGQMVEAIKQGLQQHSGQRDKQGNILCKPVREFLMGHPAVGPALQAQEASSGAGVDLTYAQIRVVREAVAAGGL